MTDNPTPSFHASLRIGVDLDNTIICYDQLFHRLATERQLIPLSLPVNKNQVRDYLRKMGSEAAWTEMQGDAYGPRLKEASAFDGALDFFRTCRALGITLFIVSHKTRAPYAGPPHDLHAAATNWLRQAGFFDPAEIGLPQANLHLELSKHAKVARIAELQCTHFIDDLPEIFHEPAFPAATVKLLFDPAGAAPSSAIYRRFANWRHVWPLLGIAQEASS